jgi:hypothetical protein
VPAGGTAAGGDGHRRRAGGFGALGRLAHRPAAGSPAPTARAAAPAGAAARRGGGAADEAEQRVSNLSRAYRVNLTVLALVALFVGAFLVFSVVSLSVAQRTPQLALLGVLGLTARERRCWCWPSARCSAPPAACWAWPLGTGLAAAALRWLAGDLGGGYFPASRRSCSSAPGALLVFGAAGHGLGAGGGWWPARRPSACPGAGAEGPGHGHQRHAPPAWPGLALLAAGRGAAFAPPVAGLPLAAYAAVAALLVGGVALVPAGGACAAGRRCRPRAALALLALQRARHQRRTATAAVAGVVASLALSVALTVMVASFRDGVAQWLDSVLPADLYARSAASSATATRPGCRRAGGPRPRCRACSACRRSRVRAAAGPGRPAVALVARPLADPAGAAAAAPPCRRTPGETGVYVSEAMVALYGARPAGTRCRCRWRESAGAGAGARRVARLRAPVRHHRHRRRRLPRLTGDDAHQRPGAVAAPGADPAACRRLRGLPDPSMLEFASAAELRALSLRIFDRSFAVTYYLQAVAIAIGLVGIAASLSAQVLARRKEFGLLAHLGLTRAAGGGHGGRRRRGLGGRRHADRPGCWAGGEHGAGVRRQPAELPLDDGPGAALGRGWRCCAPRCWPPAPPPPPSARAAPPGARGAVGEGGLVNPAAAAQALAAARWRRAALAPGRAGSRPPAPPAAIAGPAAHRSDDPVRRGRSAGSFRATTAPTSTARTEWWYATGWLGSGRRAGHGFQVTFFRSRTGLAGRQPQPLRGAPPAVRPRRAHRPAANTPRHDQRIARWSGAPQAAAGRGATRTPRAAGRWRWRRDARGLAARHRTHAGARLRARPGAARTQPLLLQGDAGFSRKGPEEAQASHYYSEPQLAARPAGARGDGGPPAAPRPRLAGPRVERRDPAPRGRGLGLDRHQPASTAAR